MLRADRRDMCGYLVGWGMGLGFMVVGVWVMAIGEGDLTGKFATSSELEAEVSKEPGEGEEEEDGWEGRVRVQKKREEREEERREEFYTSDRFGGEG